MRSPPSTTVVRCLIGLLSAASVTPATAQVSATAPAWVSGGYNGAASAVTTQFNPNTRDASNNRVVINGEIQTPGMTSVQDQFAALNGGASTATTGAGSNSTATAIGNLINVQVNGSWNTVVLSANQTNNGTVSAQTQTGPTVTAQQKASGNVQ